MTEIVEFDLKQAVISPSTFGPAEINEISATVASDFSNYRLLREAVAELEVQESRSPATAVRLGVCYYLIGRYSAAIRTLQEADGSALAHFYLGKASFAEGQYEQAKASYEAAARAGYDSDACSLGVCAAQRYAGDLEGALKTLDDLSGAVEQTAEYLYQRGSTVSSLGGNPSEVVALYERAVNNEPSHPGALFGLAMENDRRGNDHDALELYERSAARFPSHVGALLNLGLMYEDTGRFDRAASCYQRILDIYPNHQRARLYLKDAKESGNMYDHDAQKQTERLGQALNIPVTDFELSVRSRNCLERMGIHTVGDLVRTSEAELLASKNFGETSLVEIREILNSKSLQLGELAHEKRAPEPVHEPESMSDDERALHERPIADLNLSVRARKCMVRLQINTIGELIRRTGDEMLECKNFGVTSLNEVREKLKPFNIKLRGD